VTHSPWTLSLRRGQPSLMVSGASGSSVPPDARVRFGQRLRELRVERGLSQESLAARAGLDRTYISGIERGRRNLSLGNIERLAIALKVEAAELLRAPVDVP
jgi:DNA-binding XRE family transcriptional regulator